MTATQIDGRKTQTVHMGELQNRARQLAEYARQHWKHLEDISPCCVTIGNTVYPGIRFMERHTYAESKHTATFGPVAAGDYTRAESFYLLGQVPPLMERRPRPLLTGLGARCTELHRAGLPQSNHGTGEWFLAGHAAGEALTAHPDAHPFGAWFRLGEWTGPELLDAHEYRGRRKITRPRKPAHLDTDLFGTTTGTPEQIKSRLEYLRSELRAERMSYGELHELQSLAAHIKDDDIELREAAGISECD